MGEKAKARAGLLYNANYDKDLLAERIAAKDLCHEYNMLPPSKLEERGALLRRIFGKIGGNWVVEQPFLCDYGYNIEAGEYFNANHNLVILDGAPVTFGDYVFIGPNCGFYTAGHPLDAERRNKGLEYAFPIRVGNNVWIGGHTAVVGGVEIGDGSIIGAGSVVTKSIPPGVIAVGAPCRVLREITEADRLKYREA